MRKNISHPPDAPIPPLGHSMFPQAKGKIRMYITDITAPMPFCYTFKRDNESKNP